MPKWESLIMPRWEETRKIGRNRFIQLYGVVMFDCIMIFALVVSYFVFDCTITIGFFIGSFFVSTLIGYFFGKMWWENGEKRFNENKKET